MLSQKQFASVYLDSLRKRFPEISFELIDSDLSISAKRRDFDYMVYTNNAYDSYKNNPDSIDNTIGVYLSSAIDVFSAKQSINIDRVLPVIKPIDYLDEINSLSKDGKPFPLIIKKYNDQLVIAYAEDSKNSIKFLKEDDIKAIGITPDSLNIIALKNLTKLIPQIQIHGDSGSYMIAAGGTYESSLILLESVWTNENFHVKGEIVIAIPNRDMLLVTGSKDLKGIEKIKAIARDSYTTGNYKLSGELFKCIGKSFKSVNDNFIKDESHQ